MKPLGNWQLKNLVLFLCIKETKRRDISKLDLIHKVNVTQIKSINAWATSSNGSLSDVSVSSLFFFIQRKQLREYKAGMRFDTVDKFL